jgi:hypothetical protein
MRKGGLQPSTRETLNCPKQEFNWDSIMSAQFNWHNQIQDGDCSVTTSSSRIGICMVSNCSLLTIPLLADSGAGGICWIPLYTSLCISKNLQVCM